MVTIPLDNGEEYKIPWKFKVELNETYFDVEEELQKMRIWCLACPERRKTPRGVHRFIVNWLNKAHKARPRTIEALPPRDHSPISEEQRARNREHLQNLKAIVGLHRMREPGEDPREG